MQRDADPIAGLDSETARDRLARDGPNDIGPPQRRGWGGLLREVLAEPMFLLLVLAASAYLVIGEPADGAVLAMFAAVSVGLTVTQNLRGERALDALRDLSVPFATVRRSGIAQRIPARDVVVGDVLLVSEGERVAADAVLCGGPGLVVDESLLTGESIGVVKSPTALETDRRDDDATMLHAASMVLQGHGVARVAAIGRATSIGRIGGSLAGIDVAPSPLQRRLRRLVLGFGLGAAAV